MIAFAIAVIRGVASKENLEASFLGDKSDMPMAPALGLMLERVSSIFVKEGRERERERDR